MEGNEELLGNLFSLFVLRKQGHLPERVHANQLVKVDDSDLVFVSNDVLLGDVDQSKVFGEALYKGH